MEELHQERANQAGDATSDPLDICVQRKKNADPGLSGLSECPLYDLRQWKKENPHCKECHQDDPVQLIEQNQLWLPFSHKSPISQKNEEDSEEKGVEQGIKVEYGHGPAGELLYLAPEDLFLWTVLMSAHGEKLVVKKGF